MHWNFHMTMNCTAAGLPAAKIPGAYDLLSGALCQEYVIVQCQITLLCMNDVKFFREISRIGFEGIC
jgi:hypothetical protein